MAENFEGQNFRGRSASLVPRLQAMESWVEPGNDASVLHPRFLAAPKLLSVVMQILVSRLGYLQEVRI